MHRKTASVPLSLKPRTPYFPSTKVQIRQTNLSPDLHLYTNFSESQSNKASKFFTNNSDSVSKSTILKTSDPPNIPIWEIQERLESFKFRSQKSSTQKQSFEHFQKEFIIWEKTSSDINKILGQFSSELSEITSSIHVFNKKVYMDMFEFCRFSMQKAQKKVDKYKLLISGMKSEIFKMNKQVLEMKKVQFKDAEQIEAEIKEIFGDSVVNIDEIHAKLSQLRDKDRIPAADVLKDLLEKLPVGQKMPDYETASPRPLDMKDYEGILNTRFKNLQYSTAQKMIDFYENKDHLIPKFTQTQEQITDLKSFQDTKEALDKTTFQLNNTVKQLEKAREKIIECENQIDVLIQEKGKLITENLLKNNEIQNFLEKEKILKQKIVKLKTEENLGVIESPYMKEAVIESQELRNIPAHYTRNDRLEYSRQATLKIREEEQESEEKSEDELRVPFGRGSIINESRSSIYSSVRSRSSISARDTEQDQLIELSEKFEDEVKDERWQKLSILRGSESDENEEFEADDLIVDENLKNSDKNSGIHGRVEEMVRNKNESNKSQGKKNKLAVITGKEVKKVVSASEMNKGVKAVVKKIENFNNSKRMSTIPEAKSSRSESPNSQFKSSPTTKYKETKIIRPTKVESSSDIQQKRERFSDSPQIEKPKTDKKVSFSPEPKHHKTTSATFPISPSEIFPENILDRTPSIPKSDNKKPQVLIKQHSKSSNPEKNQTQSDLPKKGSIQKPNKALKDSNTFKPKHLPTKVNQKSMPTAQNSILPNINKPKPQISSPSPTSNSIEKLQNHIKNLESALSTLKETIDASVNTDPVPGSVETQDFSSQFGSEPFLRSKEPLIYMSPYNPNNIYGLKADRYFASKGVFSAQPQIPDLSTSSLFLQNYHLSPDVNSH